MTNLNTKQAKKELGDIIFYIGINKEYAAHFNSSADRTSVKYLHGKVCFYEVQLLTIELYEKYGIAYHTEDAMIKKVANKEEIKRKHKEANTAFKLAEQKELAAA